MNGSIGYQPPGGVYISEAPGPSRVDDGIRSTFVSVFTFVCFVIFLYPLVTTWHVSADWNQAFWFSRWPLVTIIVPFVLFGTYIWNARKGYPTQAAVIISIVVPFVIFMTTGAILYAQANKIQGDLRVPDQCVASSYTKVGEVDNNWVRARNFYACCLRASGFKGAQLTEFCPSGTDVEVTPAPSFADRPVIQACPGYAANDEMEYLHFLEANYGCTGFCYPGQPSLWTRSNGARDACAASVGIIFDEKIRRVGLQLMIFSGLVMIFFIVWFFISMPAFQEMARMRDFKGFGGR